LAPRLVILAAGEGSRLRPLTDHRPKAMIEISGKPLVEWQIECAERLGMKDVVVVTGYRADAFKDGRCRYYHNSQYAETNMVETLWCARPELEEEVVVSYGDILYQDDVLCALVESSAAISVVVDLGWRPYWEARFDDPLSDAESLRLADGAILEIGQKPLALDDIEGQYIGLMKFTGEGLEALNRAYESLKSAGVVGKECRPFGKMYMTDLLQTTIEAGYEVRAVPTQRGWIEIDSFDDYLLAQRHTSAGPEGVRISI